MASLAILLSRYYNQSEVAFGYPTGFLNDKYPDGAPLVWVLFNVDPEAQVTSLISSCNKFNGPKINLNNVSGNPSNAIAESPPPPEVILRCSLSTVPNQPSTKNPDGSIYSTVTNSEGYQSTLLAIVGVRLLIEFSLADDSATLNFTYSHSAYRASAIEEFSNQFDTVLGAVAHAWTMKDSNRPPILIRDIPWVGDQERTRLMTFSRMNVPIQCVNQPVHSIFSDQVIKAPHNIAVTHGHNEWTYRQLDNCSSELARVLVSQYGAQPETRIALLIPKAFAYIVALLAVLKSGAAYVPIDPEYPADRIRFVLEDSGAELVLVTESSAMVDDQLQLVPVGVPGELLIGGIGLARGYQNLPELTQAKFIDNPHGPGQVYRTGDRVRWLSDGKIEILGRFDNQIKLRGFRIELEEIEQLA
ncbi:hypothetical protein H4R33_006857, partial [Dimargaris cristalligena]